MSTNTTSSGLGDQFLELKEQLALIFTFWRERVGAKIL